MLRLLYCGVTWTTNGRSWPEMALWLWLQIYALSYSPYFVWLSLTQDRTVLDNDCFTPIKYQKNCGFTYTHGSKGYVGSLDFHPNETVMRGPSSATMVVSERELGLSSPWGFPHPCGVSEDQVGRLDFHSHPAVRRHPYPSLQRRFQKRPSGESGLPSLTSGNKAASKAVSVESVLGVRSLTPTDSNEQPPLQVWRIWVTTWTCTTWTCTTPSSREAVSLTPQLEWC